MVLQRLKEYIDRKGISVSAFEKSVGMSNASFGKSLKNGGAIGSDKLENILKIYPELNAEWLLTGSGNMIRPSAEAEPQKEGLEQELIALQRKTIDLLEEKLSRLEQGL